MRWEQADFDMFSAHQQHVSSKEYVNRLPWAAQGNPRTVGPHTGQSTLNASAST
jgi:hypothetical protein